MNSDHRQRPPQAVAWECNPPGLEMPLSASPSPGSYTLTATIQPVPGEKNTANNTLTFPVTFQ